MGKGIFGLLSHIRDTESGNIFFTLFGAVALVGAVGAASMNVMKGPVKGIADLTNRTIAENNMLASAKLAVSASTTSASAGDCDNDGFVEPVMFEASTGEPFPAGGGHLPANIGANPKDPWNTRYGYCVWDHGPTAMNPACDDPPTSGVNNRLPGTNNTTVQTIAVISAGPDRVFQTSCQSFALADAGGDADGNPDIGEDVVVRVPGSDDIVYGYTYAEANNASNDVWRLKSGDNETAEISKSLEIRDADGNISAGISSTQGSGDFYALKTNAIHAKTDPNGTTADHAYFKMTGHPGNPPIGMPGFDSSSPIEYETRSCNAWAMLAENRSWSSVSISDDGSKIVGHETPSSYYMSINSGTAFTAVTGGGTTIGNALIMPNGLRALSLASEGIIGITNNGANKSTVLGQTGLSVYGRNGQTVVATKISGGAGVWKSTNNGLSWQNMTSTVGFDQAIATSSDGSRMIAANNSAGFLQRSVNGGTTWTPIATPGSQLWRAVTSSSDGKFLVASSTTQVWTSNDSGATWANSTAGGPGGMTRLQGSQGGHYIIGIYGGDVYKSDDAGNTWSLLHDSPSNSVTQISSSTDGLKLALVQGNRIHTTNCTGGIVASSGQVDRWAATASIDAPWWDIAGASNGGTLYATIGSGGYMWKSTNGGGTWAAMLSGGSRDWRGIAASADGTIVVAASMSGNLYTTIDSGVTWTPRDSVRSWWGVASSSDGVKLAATATNGLIYTSNNSGVTWTPQPLSGSRQWQEIASSSDGVRLVAVVYNGHIYTSTDSGVNWTERIVGGGTREWDGVTMSADGLKIIAVARNGKIYTSTNGGTNWHERDTDRVWMDVAASSDGTRAAAIEHAGKIYTSKDSGATWIPQPYSPTRTWRGVWSTADGATLYATDANNGRVWVGVEGDGTSPVITIDGLSCTTGELPRWSGVSWICSADNDTNSLTGMACNNGEIVKRLGSAWVCGTDDQSSTNDNLGNHTATTNLAMGGHNIENIGTITATAYYISSDRNLKDNIQDIVDPHGLLAAIHGRHYVWKKDGKPAFGVIAQDVSAIMPEAVTKTTEGTLAVEYDQLLPAMIEATKDLKERNAKLRAEIDALKQQTP